MGLFGKNKQSPVMENRFKPQVEAKPGRHTSAPKKAEEPIAGVQDNTTKKTGSGKSRKGFRPVVGIRSVLDGTLLTNEKFVKNIPYLLFVTALAVFYIANSATAERNRRELTRLNEDLKEYRYMYISTKSSVMYLSNQSQISKRLNETGIKENIIPPVKIFIPAKSERQETSSGR